MAAVIRYAKVTCGRCAGAKFFNCWSHIAGGRCFKCNGRGYFLTANGRRASAKVSEFLKANFTIPVADLKPGDLVRTTHGLKRVVKSVEPSENGYWTVTYTKPIENLHGIVLVDSELVSGGLVKVLTDGPDWEKVVAYARSLKLKGLTVVEGES